MATVFGGTAQLPGQLSNSHETYSVVPYHNPFATEISFKGRPTVSVIIPTLNEAKNLPLLFPYLPRNWIDEVILVDGRSSDNTVEVARQLMPDIKVVMELRKGKGAAMKAGYRAATGEILIVLDADGSNDPREIPRFVIALMQGADFVKGSRFATGGGTTDMPLFRKLGNGGFVLMSNMLFGVNFTDLCYGFHAFWRHCLDAYNLDNMDGFEIDTAIYLQSVRERLRIVEVPSFEGFRFYGVGKLRTFPDGIRVLKTIMREWRTYLKQKQGDLYLGFRGFKFEYAELYSLPGSGMEKPSNVTNAQFMQLLNAMVMARGDIKWILENLLQLSLQTMDASGGSLIMLDHSGEISDGCLAYGDKIDPNFSADIVRQGLVGWVIQHQQPVLIADTRQDNRWLKRPWDEASQSRSAIAYPLMSGEKVVGVLTLTRTCGRTFSEKDLLALHDVMLIPSRVG